MIVHLPQSHDLTVQRSVFKRWSFHTRNHLRSILVVDTGRIVDLSPPRSGILQLDPNPQSDAIDPTLQFYAKLPF